MKRGKWGPKPQKKAECISLPVGAVALLCAAMGAAIQQAESEGADDEAGIFRGLAEALLDRLGQAGYPDRDVVLQMGAEFAGRIEARARQAVFLERVRGGGKENE